jgi:hypothetical protein
MITLVVMVVVGGSVLCVARAGEGRGGILSTCIVCMLFGKMLND